MRMSAEKGAQSSCARLKELTVVVEVDVLKITISQQFPNAARQFRSGKGDHAGEYRADEDASCCALLQSIPSCTRAAFSPAARLRSV